MSIKSVTTEFAGQTGINPRLIRIVCNDSYETITTENWIRPLISNGYSFLPTDIVFIAYGSQSAEVGIFTVLISGSNITLEPFYGDQIHPSSEVLPTVSSVEAPVTVGHFASFQDTEGTIGDEGYSPTSAATYFKLASYSGFGSAAANYFPVFNDADGTIKGSTGATGIYNGNIQAGGVTLPGYLASYPTGLNAGSLRLQARPNFSDVTTTIQNAPVNFNTIYTLANPVITQAYIMMTDLSPIVASNLICFDTTFTAAALAGGAELALYVPPITSLYKVRSMQINAPGVNFSGGGGNRLLSITDQNAHVYSSIPAASLQALTNALWGSAAFPFPASIPANQNPDAGFPVLIVKYSGGTTDYSTGSVTISGILQQIQ